MSFLFGGGRVESTNTVRDYQRKVAGSARSMEREMAKLDRKEGVLHKELTKHGKDFKIDLATAKAKEIVRLRSHRKKLLCVKTQMTGLEQQLQTMHATGKVQEIIGNTVSMLHSLNGRMDAGNMVHLLKEFERQSVQMQAKQEIVDDVLEAGFEADGEQEDCNEAVIRVLEEAGLDVSEQLRGNRSARKPLLDEAAVSDEDIINRLEKLRSA